MANNIKNTNNRFEAVKRQGETVITFEKGCISNYSEVRALLVKSFGNMDTVSTHPVDAEVLLKNRKKVRITITEIN